MINKILSFCGRLLTARWTSSSRTMTSSASSDMLLCEAAQFVPKLTSELHKGQCGRVGVVGGSFEYTGAPYFAAISALKLGVDIVNVICSPEAAPIIKSYSPELIVYPYVGAEFGQVRNVLQRLHALVIGPGLSRSEDARRIVAEIFTNSELSIPVVVDADGLFFIAENPSLVKSYRGPVVLTPNAVEYARLCQSLNVDQSEEERVARELGVVLVRKGHQDVIINGLCGDECPAAVCSVQGCPRRCGGQGDVLSGSIAAFAAWFAIATYKGAHYASLDDRKKKGLTAACFACCSLTRCCSAMAFARYGRSMTTSDMIQFIHDVFVMLFEK